MPDPKAFLLLPLHSTPLQQLVLLETVPVTHLIASVLTPFLVLITFTSAVCFLHVDAQQALSSVLILFGLRVVPGGPVHVHRRTITQVLRMPMSVFSCLELCWAPELNYLPAYQHHQRPALGQFHMQPADESDTISHIVTQGQNLGIIFHITLSLPYLTSHQLQILQTLPRKLLSILFLPLYFHYHYLIQTKFIIASLDT